MIIRPAASGVINSRYGQSSKVVERPFGSVRGGERPLGLPSPRNYRGREGAAIPAAGIVLQGATGGTPPYAYSMAGLPPGLAFNAATRTITGTPTTASPSHVITYTATDSASPAASAARVFRFPVVDAGDEVTLDDWDHTGYGLNTLDPDILVVLESDTAVVGTEGTVIMFARQNRGNVGFLLDAAGQSTSDLSLLQIPGGPVINWVRTHPNNGRVTLNHSAMGPNGEAIPYEFVNSFTSTARCYIQDKLGVAAIPVENIGGGFMRFRPATADVQASRDVLARLDAGVHYIVALKM